MTTTNTTPRCTNRGMGEYVGRREAFCNGNNTVHGRWHRYMPSTGRLPAAWAQDLRSAFKADAEIYVVFSYSTPIAWFVPGEGWVEPDVKYSVTTSKQLGQVRGGYEWRDARRTLAAKPDPRNNADDAFAVFMAMPASEWAGLISSLLHGGVLTPAEKIGFDRALGERKALVPPMRHVATRTCPECGRVFDLSNPVDADELAYGHDCEV